MKTQSYLKLSHFILLLAPDMEYPYPGYPSHENQRGFPNGHEACRRVRPVLLKGLQAEAGLFHHNPVTARLRRCAGPGAWWCPSYMLVIVSV